METLVHSILSQTNDSSRDAKISNLIDQMTSRFVTDVDLKERMEIWRQKLGKEFEQEVQVIVTEKVQVKHPCASYFPPPCSELINLQKN